MILSSRYKYFMGLLAFVVIVSASTIFNSCKQKNASADLQGIPDSQLDGKALVSKYCTRCHALTPVNALNNDVWQYHTLPDMATYMGISTYGTGYFKREGAEGIGIADWERIVDYYKKHAPVTLDAQKRPDTLVNDWAGFAVKLPKGNGGVRTAYTTMVSVDPASHKIYSSDAATAKLFTWDKALNPSVVGDVPSQAVNMEFVKSAAGSYNGVLTCVGELQPMDYPNGKIVGVDLGNAKMNEIQSDISRPMHASGADFNKDGLLDYIVSAEGKVNGQLLLLMQKADHSYTRVILKKPQGAVQTVVGDFNHDGWPDIMALFGLGDEGLILFTNNQKGGFTERQLLRFPPTNGSTSLQITDVNHDGKPDVIYTCGYNYRDSRIMKPYHGMYIYLNSGNWNLKQNYFYPINGCTKAIAADFDGDGDIDIATSAFFADLKNQPGESFVYFEQDKAMHFKPHAIPVSKYGRWFNMAVGDYNGDGKPDIVLGNYSRGLTIEGNLNTNNNENIPLIVLENHTGK